MVRPEIETGDAGSAPGGETSPTEFFMSDPRNIAHAKKVIQEKKHQGAQAGPGNTLAVQPGKKATTAKVKHGHAGADRVSNDAAAVESAIPSQSAASKPPAMLEGSLIVLAKLKDLELHSRANVELLPAVTRTTDAELT